MASPGSSRHSPASTRSAHSPNVTRTSNAAARAPAPLVTSPTGPRSPADSDVIRSSPTSDRPIRPLPRRRIRDRLSAEQADALIFPSVPERQPLFSFPYPSEYDDRALAASRPSMKDKDGRPVTIRPGFDDQDRFIDRGYVRKDEGQYSRDFEKPSKKAASHTARMQSRMASHGKVAQQQSSMSIGSANSSIDGDEGFENTNNKKKRKIPQSNGSLGSHHSALLADLANINLSSLREAEATGGAESSVTADGSSGQYGSGATTSATGLLPSTPISLSQLPRIRTPRSGRGSLDRRPLGNSTNGVNYAASARRASGGLVGGKSASSHHLASSSTGKGIISSAIANAQSEELSTPVKGSENISLLQQQLANKSPPQIDHFSFTCEDPSTNKVVWPGNTNMSATDPNYPMPPSQHPDASRRAPPNPNGGPSQGQQTGQQPPPPPKKKIRPGRLYEIAARQRRINQRWANQQHPPKREDIWICEFCEYEAIYGVPPAALIRQYEKKDRKAQKALAERRRMLEKVKQKGRKNKKNAKATQKSLAHHAAEFQKREFLRNTQNVGSSTQGVARREDGSQFGVDYSYDPDRYDDVPDTEEDYVDEDEQDFDADDYEEIQRSQPDGRYHHMSPPPPHHGDQAGGKQRPGTGFVTTEVYGH